MDVDLFGHLNKTTKSSKKKKRTSSLDEKTETPTENADVKRRKLATTSTAKTQKEEPTKMDVDSNSSKTKTIIHRHKLKGGAGTQSKNCVHEVALPPNSSLSETELLAATSEQPLKMAKKYKFELDPFQKQSVACIEQEQSVLVAAHTSAGKTAVAEYAVAKSLKGGQRVIYTSPIKALSNQKYRDLVEGFQDVGLMTGDVTINPNASCLVMTTEILRSMLYRGSEVMREVAWVIFDEVHYMRDRDRGVVWEESIIMLPHKVKFVFLSATIPNAFEFAAWVAKVHDQPCHVVYTEYRPTPLEHYIFPAGGEGLHLVVDGDGNFREKSFQKAVSTLASTNLEQQLKDQAKSKSRRKQKKQAGDDLYRIIKMIMKREYNPVIVFSFSKKDCETNALALSKLNMNSSDESDLVEKVFKSALESLSEEDRKLPQIQAILPLLKRGIGIHHGGLLPILKEVIEILFGEGLLKCLFATETFAMGVNMPAKTVVFTSARKFDGKEFRFINSNEYVQMSGRAGRRNVDTRGIVIQMLDEKMEQTQIKRILKGFGDPLQSSFHLGYNMLLNLLRVEDSDPEFMMRHSLHQFQKEIQVPKLEGEVEKLQLEVSEIKFPDNMEAPTEDYCRMLDQIEEQKKTMIKVSSMPDFATPFLQLGRLIRVVENEEDWGLGVVISFCAASEHPVVQAKDRNNTNTMIEVVGAEIGCSDSDFIVDVALRCQRLQGATSMTLMTRPRPCNNSGGGEIRVVPVLLQCIREISAIRINVPKDLTRRDKLQSVWKSIQEVKRRFPDLPKLDPEVDMGIDDTTEHGKKFLKAKKRIKLLQDRVQKSLIYKSDKKDELVKLYNRRRRLERTIAMHNKDLKSVQKLALRETLLQMKRVLRRLGHISNEDILTLKARVACEVNAADELLVTELLFEGTFNDLHPNVAVAILAAFADTGKVSEDADSERDALPEELRGPFRALQDAARRVAKTQEDCGIEIDPEEYAKSFNAENVKIAYLWCNKDMTFAKIMKETSQFEGSIVRMIRRLEELAREVAASCAALGNQSLQKKFETGITNIKRDIVFAASLYL